jgi:predicted DCC family thiol-disulfide oxidoreductase YuxK
LFHYAALQSVAGQRIVQELGVATPRFETVLLVKKGKVFTASTAVLEIVKNLSGGWFLLYGLIVVPRPVRDFFYIIVAKNRSRFFGKRSQCLVSVHGREDRFLV